ncbi:MAG: segregation/condensation protein A, partial [Pseudomonadales bacterium]|nr:segregation/condensation protein A [Pseudomonadales bacterium]
LPRQSELEDDENDPRAELIRRLQEYERYKQAAEDINELPRVGRDVFIAEAGRPDFKKEIPAPDVDLKDVLLALQGVLQRADMFESHQVEREKLSTRERMSEVLEFLDDKRFVPFEQLFTAEEGRLGVVVTFLAILELIKEQLIEIIQHEPFGSIHVKARASALEEAEPETESEPEES